MTMTPSVVNNNQNGHGINPNVNVNHHEEREKEKERVVILNLAKDPDMDHKPDDYEDLKTSDYHPSIFTALERFLPPEIRASSRDYKILHMNRVLHSYLPRGERNRAQKHREYKEKIRNNYLPLHRQLYNLNPNWVFVPSFLEAVKENTEVSYKRVVSEPSPGIYTFRMLHPEFCELLLAEVENFHKWVELTKFRIMRPNTMNKYGVVLDDFGLDTMLDNMMRQFISPMAAVYFPSVCGSSLDSHHGFIVEYSKDRDLELGFHVDDSEVTLNVCLGRHFTGGDLFFRGVRCENHVNCQTYPEEIFEYPHVPGQAILHAGRHRHGAKTIISGQRTNLILWCRSSTFREFKKHKNEFPDWCGECLHQKQERQRNMLAARRQELQQSNQAQ